MKLSIITINRNNAEGLKRTLDSVKVQTCQEFEHIIIDGASTDDSVEIIESYVRDVSCMKYDVLWVSEPDKGIYEAMNKGIEIVSGKRVVNSFNRSERREDKNKGCEDSYVLMLNSGDYLVDELVIERILPELDGTDIIQGNNIENHAGVQYRNRGYGKSEIDLYDVLKGHFLHQASFCRRELFDKYGYFDESYRISGDTKFFMNSLGVHDATFRYVDIDVANYDMNGISAAKSGALYRKGKEEYKRIVQELFSHRIVEHFYVNEKKIRLYNELHEHSWIWGLSMILVKISSLWYKKHEDIIINKVEE